MVAFTVIGRSEPSGSKSAYVRGGHANVVDASPKSKPWKKLVKAQAREAMIGHELMTGALSVTFTFYRAFNVGDVLKDGSLSTARLRNPYPTVRPDLLKLARSIEDAMTGVVYADDSQIVDEFLHKRYPTSHNFKRADRGSVARVIVAVRELQL